MSIVPYLLVATAIFGFAIIRRAFFATIALFRAGLFALAPFATVVSFCTVAGQCSCCNKHSCACR